MQTQTHYHLLACGGTGGEELWISVAEETGISETFATLKKLKVSGHTPGKWEERKQACYTYHKAGIETDASVDSRSTSVILLYVH